jgi:general secretion pathway protein D
MKQTHMGYGKRSILNSAARAALPMVVVVGSAAMIPSSALAQPATQPATQPTTMPANGNGHSVTTAPGGGFVFNFKDAQINTVLDDLSAAGGFIIIKEVNPQGRISATSRQPLSSDDAVAVLNTLIKNAGYAAVRSGRILKIMPLDKAKHSGIPVKSVTDPAALEPTDELITAVIPIGQADAMQLKQDLAPLINPEADFTANQSSNALIITDTAANIRRVVEIVSALDKHLAGSVEVKVFQLQFASASAAAQLVNDLFGETGTSGRGTNRNNGNQNPFQRFFGGGGTPFGGGGPGGGGGGPGGGGNRGGGNNQNQGNQREAIPVKASADDRTNTVVVAGPPESLIEVEKIVKQLDANPAAEEQVND